ncbi:hypothetical protein CK203_101373 [Vitis vinifera]|uniref:Uncharacterized protein n=1 Tax=Vitis vinifera TaxID=29760 RepID=A0A438D3G6_VITVI|nr:hypothetical protein CK203_101373 [Vitis vinifera]
MEESKEFVAHSATYSSQRLQSTFGSPTESRGPQHTARMFPSDKPGHPPISSGGFQPASPLGNVSAATSTPLPYQLPHNEVRSSIASSGLATSNLEGFFFFLYHCPELKERISDWMEGQMGLLIHLKYKNLKTSMKRIGEHLDDNSTKWLLRRCSRDWDGDRFYCLYQQTSRL